MKKPLLAVLRSRFPSVAKKDLHAAVLCGEVYVDGERIRDPRRSIDTSREVEVRRERYVSRGGQKLEGAIAAFEYPVRGRVFVDVGASTGGFTDCLLQHGAALVHAVDSGTNQLAYTLRRDPRVLVIENTPIQAVGALDPVPDAAAVDLSFRSLAGVVPQILSLTRSGEGIFLLKPQFEWSNPPDSFDGVVRNRDDLAGILLQAFDRLYAEGAEIADAVESPIRGHEGNREFLLLLRRRALSVGYEPSDLPEVVEKLLDVGRLRAAQSG